MNLFFHFILIGTVLICLYAMYASYKKDKLLSTLFLCSLAVVSFIIYLSTIEFVPKELMISELIVVAWSYSIYKIFIN